MNYHIMPSRSIFTGSLERKHIERIENHLTRMCAKYFQEFTEKIDTILQTFYTFKGQNDDVIFL